MIYIDMKNCVNINVKCIEKSFVNLKISLIRLEVTTNPVSVSPGPLLRLPGGGRPRISTSRCPALSSPSWWWGPGRWRTPRSWRDGGRWSGPRPRHSSARSGAFLISPCRSSSRRSWPSQTQLSKIACLRPKSNPLSSCCPNLTSVHDIISSEYDLTRVKGNPLWLD